ncbi:MarR family winged helix-turn-helix transcriptional regulator [Tepidimonas sp.]|uniref:MarR family winged helix-turn-helix transcriptional regulator n=1 Tax=Tepidimonas sp. TaxID=2002775 RepID=UPI00399FFCFA
MRDVNDPSHASIPPSGIPPGAGSTAADTSFLESLVGYNARRAALAIIAQVLPELQPYDLRVVEFSVLTVVAHNPGITSRQVCAALDILPPNLVGLLRKLEQRGLIHKRAHPSDRRAQGLYVTDAGAQVQRAAQHAVAAVEQRALPHLSAAERATLIALLRRVYQGSGAGTTR